MVAFGHFSLGCPEIGYVSLSELATVRGRLGPPVERDRHFETDKRDHYYSDRARLNGTRTRHLGAGRQPERG